MLKLQQNSDIWQIYCIRQPKILNLTIDFIQKFNYLNEIKSFWQLDFKILNRRVLTKNKIKESVCQLFLKPNKKIKQMGKFGNINGILSKD
ncbi:hypothetical protein BpHYR1_021544 [Brachionus plicatilis]|uniref:Uncharacterized protein n=1 Tax=Brachionus plicatilis TaxID=10195 RepID=A0A3M7SXQ6_BRAPC|nr:hypothetical protein BpHYR1_021544 [Brachionus plicatilis]